MATYKVTFEPACVTVEADPQRYPYGSHGLPGSLLDIALGAGVHVEHACGGACACGTCHVIVERGAGSLSEPREEELDLVEVAPGNTADSRLACMAVVGGDVTVRIPGWNRNAAAESTQTRRPRTMPAIRWKDAEEIGQRLFEAFPQVEPLTVRFADLHAKVLTLPGFADDSAASSEEALQAIQMAWLDCYRDGL